MAGVNRVSRWRHPARLPDLPGSYQAMLSANLTVPRPLVLHMFPDSPKQ
jgi:hypothetical protein